MEAADEEQKKYFGNRNEQKGASDNKSRITFSDVHFKVNEGLRLEYRTRVRLDAKSGTAGFGDSGGAGLY